MSIKVLTLAEITRRAARWYMALMFNSGIPRGQIVLAYKGETLPEVVK